MASSRRPPGAPQAGCCGPGRAPRLCVDAGVRARVASGGGEARRWTPGRDRPGSAPLDWETLGQGKTEHTQR